MFARKSGLLAAVGMAILLSSCTEERTLPGKLPTYPVKGQVFVNGKPGEGVIVRLHPTTPLKSADAAGVPNPGSGVDKEGNLSFMTYDTGDGAPAGDYTATFVWAPPRMGGLKGLGGETVRAPDKLGGKYEDPTKSEFKVTVTEQGADMGKIDLEADPAALEE